MAVRYLPTTAITSMVMNDTIYAYAQVYEGDLCEVAGHTKTENGKSTYVHDKRNFAFAVTRVEGDTVVSNAPKLLTPLAAAPFNPSKNNRKNTRYLFYLNDKNILCDALNDGTGWKAGKLALSNVVCAHYSKLASITVCNNWYNFICVYYQAPTEDAAIKMISLSGYTGNWADGSPDLKDPPLFGTSLAAVQSRPGISVLTSADKDGIQQPVYYLQMDNLCLGHAQGTSDPVVMSGLELDGRSLVFSPHTSLTAVDDGSKLYIIYKSNNNSIKMIEIVDHRPNPPEKFKSIDTTPMSAIAACLSPDKKVVLFYQSLDTTTKQVHLFGCTLYKAAVNSTEWVQSTPVKLGQ